MVCKHFSLCIAGFILLSVQSQAQTFVRAKFSWQNPAGIVSGTGLSVGADRWMSRHGVGILITSANSTSKPGDEFYKVR